MSAFQVTGTHIAAMVGTMWAKDRYGEWDQAKAREIALILAKENARSVVRRYAPREWPPVEVKPEELRHFRFHPLAPVEMFKAIHCFCYQACETEDWEETEAHTICARMKAQTAERMPGYDEAPWGIEDGWRQDGGTTVSLFDLAKGGE